ncbi:LURP-one-related/scramblase family protein [Streptococcus ferus]|uniref:Protein of uncharacterized function (DUF567) n=1 Tax=Streptococcus ferus TaxID=1345 RepID=A0A2X3Y1S1_9STRE|nr:LURP-one-related family protein [Streptococcus ferus]SQF40732.1 Protein of uncharacterised function (DUF567) [Streptococcus ferus]
MTQVFEIKQGFFSLGGKFAIKDTSGIPQYHVEGSFLQIPKEFLMTDRSGKVVSRITKKFLALLPQFSVELADGTHFQIVKELTFFKARYRIDNLNLTVQGDFWDMNFDLYQGSQLIARISQEWLQLTSTYHVEVYDEAFNDLVISLVIAIDCVKADQAAAASSASH